MQVSCQYNRLFKKISKIKPDIVLEDTRFEMITEKKKKPAEISAD